MSDDFFAAALASERCYDKSHKYRVLQPLRVHTLTPAEMKMLELRSELMELISLKPGAFAGKVALEFKK